MKKMILMMISVCFVNLAYATDPRELCSEELTGEPVVTELENGVILICTLMPTAYMTQAEAKKAAVQSNRQAAQQVCENGFSNVQKTRILKEAHAVGALSLIQCRK